MNINLSWDLFILVFFGVVIAYSFIIGRNQTLKVITSTYIAILCADGIGNLFTRNLIGSDISMKFLKLFAIGGIDQATAFFKILILIIIIVIIAVRGIFDFTVEDTAPMTIRLAVILSLGVLSAGLMMSAMLIFVSGGSLVSSVLPMNGPLTSIYAQSRLVKIMVDYSNIWFILPGIALVLISYFNKK